MSDRELALQGGLLRAIGMMRDDYNIHRIIERILEVWPDATWQQAYRIVLLAQDGVAAAAAINWKDPTAIVDTRNAPQLPR